MGKSLFLSDIADVAINGVAQERAVPEVAGGELFASASMCGRTEVIGSLPTHTQAYSASSEARAAKQAKLFRTRSLSNLKPYRRSHTSYDKGI